ncbi:MAG: hypothetical protein EB017_09645 [Betaproteobacteria bacterium]|nr:hypothetical protein [Betaproteobacteria bacterium]
MRPRVSQRRFAALTNRSGRPLAARGLVTGGKRPGQKPGLLFLFHAKPWLNDGNRYYRVFLLAHRILVRWQA